MNVINHPDWLKQGTRIVMRLRRNKDGGVGSVDRHAKKIITRNAVEWQGAVDKLLADIEDGERIYSLLERRSFKKAIHEFKRRQLENDLADSPQEFYVDSYNRFVSCLQNPRSREETLFLWDCDSVKDEDELWAIPEIRSNVAYFYYTKSGQHIITQPFAYPRFVPEKLHTKLMKGAMVLVAY